MGRATGHRAYAPVGPRRSPASSPASGQPPKHTQRDEGFERLLDALGRMDPEDVRWLFGGDRRNPIVRRAAAPAPATTEDMTS
jgi:hypothetical protein